LCASNSAAVCSAAFLSVERESHVWWRRQSVDAGSVAAVSLSHYYCQARANDVLFLFFFEARMRNTNFKND